MKSHLGVPITFMELPLTSFNFVRKRSSFQDLRFIECISCHIVRSQNMSKSPLPEWVLEVLQIWLSASGLFLSHLDQEGHWNFLCFLIQFIYGY